MFLWQPFFSHLAGQQTDVLDAQSASESSHVLLSHPSQLGSAHATFEQNSILGGGQQDREIMEWLQEGSDFKVVTICLAYLEDHVCVHDTLAVSVWFQAATEWNNSVFSCAALLLGLFHNLAQPPASQADVQKRKLQHRHQLLVLICSMVLSMYLLQKVRHKWVLQPNALSYGFRPPSSLGQKHLSLPDHFQRTRHADPFHCLIHPWIINAPRRSNA